MWKRVSNVVILCTAMATAACAVDEVPEPSTGQVTSATEQIERPTLVFQHKPFWSTWGNFCAALEAFEVRVTVAGCTTSTTYDNCTAGTVSGTCRCDMSTSRSGTC